MAQNLGILKSALHERSKDGYIEAHSKSINPSPTEAKKISRLEFTIYMLDPLKLESFVDMMDRVHVHER